MEISFIFGSVYKRELQQIYLKTIYIYAHTYIKWW